MTHELFLLVGIEERCETLSFDEAVNEKLRQINRSGHNRDAGGLPKSLLDGDESADSRSLPCPKYLYAHL